MRDLIVGQGVTYNNNPFDWSVPIDGRITKVEKIMGFRSQSSGNQCVLLEGDCMVRDINGLTPIKLD